MARVIAVVSGKGGVGKTTVTANLGIVLGATGYKVTLIDADVGLNNLDIALGLEDRVVYDIFDVIAGRVLPEEALIKSEEYPGIGLLPSVKGSDGIKAAAFQAITEIYAKDADYVLIDAPAGVEAGFHRAVSAAKEVIIVTTPNLSAVKDADRTLETLSVYDAEVCGLVVNRVIPERVQRGEAVSGERIAELMRLKLLGELPESDEISINSLFSAHGQSGQAYFRLAEAVVSGKEAYRVGERKRGFSLFGRRRR